MHPLSDKDLDRLSREAAEQYDVDQSPSGWEHLEQRLNKELPPQKEKDRRRFLWIFFLFLLLTGSSLVWMLADKNGNETAVKTDSISDTRKNETSQPVTSSSETKTTEDKKNENGNAVTTPVTGKKSGSDNAIPSNSDLTVSSTPTTEKNISQEKIKSNPTLVKDQTVSAKRSGSTRKKTIVTVAGAEPSIKNSANKGTDPLTSKPEKNETAKKDDSQKSVPAPIVPVPDKATVQPDASSSVNNKTNAQSTDKDQPEPAAANPATASSEKKKEKSKEKTNDRFAFSVLAGIDKSNIHGTGSNKLGYNFGAQVSFNLSKRWSLNTGFIYTKKNYSAKGEDFHPPKHYWTNYVTLNSLDGNCVMWDIPLNVRYNITTKPSNTWFVSTGLSSYIMRKQAYTYDYMYLGSPTSRDWETNSQENEWFKILNLSAGYERTLNKSWSIQAEPFVKVPLSGVGFGSMDMSSYGILVGIKYKPVFNKTKTTPAAKTP